MKYLLRTFFVLIALGSFSSPVLADGSGENIETPIEALCIPGNYFENSPNDCLLIGAAAHQTDRAEMAAAIHAIPGRYYSTDEELGQTGNRYIMLDGEASLKLYSSLDRAAHSDTSDGNFPGGYSFASFTSRQNVEGNNYYLLKDGRWIKGSDVVREVTPTRFSGILPSRGDLSRPFGWVLYGGETQTSPGWYSPKSGHFLTRYDIVEVFDTITLDGYTWHQIGLDEWVDQRWLGLVYPTQDPPTGVKNGRWIELNLFEQTVAVYENGNLVFATLTTSGSDRYFTRPGLFQIFEKVETTTMGGGVEADNSDRYYLQGVPWSMYFDEARAFHGEYWHDHLGYQSSHGCANLSFADAEWLYNWAELGDWVYIWDPSGETPVEEHLFTQLIEP